MSTLALGLSLGFVRLAAIIFRYQELGLEKDLLIGGILTIIQLNSMKTVGLVQLPEMMTDQILVMFIISAFSAIARLIVVLMGYIRHFTLHAQLQIR